MPNGSSAAEETAVVVRQPEQIIVQGAEFLPVMDIGTAIARHEQLMQFTARLMHENEDFGTIPGTNKPTLLKPGAEKLQTFFGLEPYVEVVEEVKDWTGADHGGEPFFYFKFRYSLMREGKVLGVGIGSANSWESKYRYRWVSEDRVPEVLDKAKLQHRDGSVSEFAFAIDKAETSGPYGKPAEYWRRFHDAIAAQTARKTTKTTSKGKEMDAWAIGAKEYRIPNPDIADQVNTIEKMAFKRAQIAATLNGTGASQLYTQDLEDLPREYATGESYEQITNRRIDEMKSQRSSSPAGDSRASSEPAPAQRGAAAEAQPPVAAPEPDEPEALRALLGELRAGKRAALTELLSISRGEYQKAMGTDALYLEILERHGMKSPSDKVTMAQAEDLIRELWYTAQKIQQDQAAEPEPLAEPEKYQATDDDLPEGLFDQEEPKDA